MTPVNNDIALSIKLKSREEDLILEAARLLFR